MSTSENRQSFNLAKVSRYTLYPDMLHDNNNIVLLVPWISQR